MPSRYERLSFAVAITVLATLLGLIVSSGGGQSANMVSGTTSSDGSYVLAHEALGKAWQTDDLAAKNALLQQAIEHFSHVLQASPDNLSAYINRGAAYHALGQYELAIADQTKALTIEPALIDARQNRGESFEGMGKKYDALADFELALHELERHPGPETRAKRKVALAEKVKLLRAELAAMDS